MGDMVVQQDQGFEMNYSMPCQSYPNHLEKRKALQINILYSPVHAISHDTAGGHLEQPCIMSEEGRVRNECIDEWMDVCL